MAISLDDEDDVHEAEERREEGIKAWFVILNQGGGSYRILSRTSWQALCTQLYRVYMPTLHVRALQTI